MTVIKTDTEISKLIINTLSQSQYLEAKEAGTISDTEMYVVTDDVEKQKMVSALNLFDYKWSDHLLNSKLWIRADNFQWHSNVYFSIAYNHLVTDIDGKTATTETIGETTITYYLADDGHKIVLSDQESNVTAIYEATGVAWYYILDTTNQRFKLPRTKFAFTGLRDGAGNYVEAGAPTITTDGWAPLIHKQSGNGSGSISTGSTTMATTTDHINPIYGNSDTIQPPATQMYLYCYIGEDAMVENAGIDLEVLDNKVDIDDLVNVVTIVDTYHGVSSWYRIYSDGWCEQGGITSGSTYESILLPAEFSTTDYNVSIQMSYTTSVSAGAAYAPLVGSRATTGFQIIDGNTNPGPKSWYACGYIS